MRVGSLFAGIGGFDIAAERVGMEVVWQSEIDEKASKVLAYHWPGIPNYGDIHAIKTAPRVDVLTGGFPCQDYSVAGAGAGLAGDRGALWWEYHRLIAALRPTWVVGENVPGLIASNDGRDFETIIGSLTQLGYGVAWAVLDAQYFGVAQRRRRVFIVGHSGGSPRPEVLALAEGLYGNPEPRREKREGAAGPTPVGVGGDSEIAYSVTTPSGGMSAKQNQFSLVVEPEQIVFAQNQRDEVRELDDIAGALAAESGMKQRTYVAKTAFTESNGWGILDDGTAHTVDSSGPEAVIQAWAMPTVRRLTPLECERLQGFPDGWTDIPSNKVASRYRQLGNAVAVPVVEWILKNIALFS